MAEGTSYTLDGTPQNLNPNGTRGARGMPAHILVKNPEGGNDIRLGGSDVTLSTGFLLEPGESVSIPIVNGTIYGVGANTVWVLIT